MTVNAALLILRADLVWLIEAEGRAARNADDERAPAGLTARYLAALRQQIAEVRTAIEVIEAATAPDDDPPARPPRPASRHKQEARP